MLTQVWKLARQLSHDDGVTDVLVGVASVLRALPHDHIRGVSPSSDHVLPVRAPCSKRSKVNNKVHWLFQDYIFTSNMIR